jgi:hypothetical protein
VAGAKLSRRLLNRESGVVAPWPQGARWESIYGDGVAITPNGLIEMVDKSLEEEQAVRVDERLVRAVRIIVEQFDGDVKAFVQSIRYREEVNRKAAAASDHGDEAALQRV